jgi:uncharacterized protein YcbK (DUF882 family)
MPNSTFKNLEVPNETDLSSRRKFLKNITFGSLLFLTGTQIANAKAKQLATRKVVARKIVEKSSSKPVFVASKGNQKLKTAITNRLAKKSDAHEKKLVAVHTSSKTKNELHRDVKNTHHETVKNQKNHKLAEVHHHNEVRHHNNHLVASNSKRSVMYRNDALILDTREDRQLFVTHIPSKMIALQNPHTGDHLKLTYFERGLYIEDALEEIDYIFRDHHTGDIHPVDPALLDQLYELKLSLNVSRPFNIVSGYRSPETNANLRRHSDGVAKNSLHMQGRAIDIRLDGYDTRTIRDAALAMQRGGVGYYPDSNFVHIDTGNVRSWGV